MNHTKTAAGQADTFFRAGYRLARQRLHQLAISITAVVLFIHVIGRLVSEWSTNSVCEHVPFTLPVALAVLIHRLVTSATDQHSIRRRTITATGVILVIASSFMIWLDMVMTEVFFLAVGLWLGGLATVSLLAGQAAFKASLLPFVLLAFAIAPPQGVTQLTIHHELQHLTATTAAGLLSLAGADVLLAGTTIQIDGQYLNVAEPCSGYRFLIILLFNAILIGGYLLGPRLILCVMLAVTAIIIAVLTNIVRIAAAGLIMMPAGEKAATQFLHGPAVWLVYLAGSLMLLLAAMAFADQRWQIQHVEQEGEGA